MKKQKPRWTFSGIKAHFPNLPYTAWLKICKAGGQYYIFAADCALSVRW